MSAQPNDNVMTAALTRRFGKTAQFWVGRKTAAASVELTSVAAADCSSTSVRIWQSCVDHIGSSGSWSQKVVTGCWPLKVKVKVNVDLYSASSWEPHLYKGLRCGSHSFTCKHTTPAFKGGNVFIYVGLFACLFVLLLIRRLLKKLWMNERWWVGTRNSGLCFGTDLDLEFTCWTL